MNCDTRMPKQSEIKVLVKIPTDLYEKYEKNFGKNVSEYLREIILASENFSNSKGD